MHCKVNLTNQDASDQVVKRRFIPIHFTIDHKTQFINASVKLPFTSNKVIGVLTCSKVNPCDDTPQTPRYYFGITDQLMTDTRFLKDTKGIEYTTTYPPKLNLKAIKNKYWYFAHPVTDLLPSIAYDGLIRRLGKPIPVSIKKQGQCNAEPHYLWSAEFPETDTVIIGFFRFL